MEPKPVRQARVADYMKRLTLGQNEWKARLQRFAVEDLRGVGNLELAIQSPVTVFAGPSGVGKTTLLRALWAAFDLESARPTITASRKFSGGRAIVELINDGRVEAGEVVFSGSSPEAVQKTGLTATHVDGAGLTPVHQKAFCEFEGIEEIVNGEGALNLDQQALDEISAILHRQYRSITLYEVELEERVPFFEVVYGNDSYDSRTMGTGELSALYIWWAIRRAEPNTLLLLEEPEAFLSFGAQKTLADFVFSNIAKKKLLAVIGSHSAAFISRLPHECIVYLARSSVGINAIVDRPPPILLKAMGMQPPVTTVVFVEDTMAMLWLRSILENITLYCRGRYTLTLEGERGRSSMLSRFRPKKKDL